MENLTEEDILYFHEHVQKRFDTIIGIEKEGLIDSIVKRPSLRLYGNEIYPDVYSKAASIMEALIRWHVFVDGNKRTALLATDAYLTLNNYFVDFPLHAVRYTVLIAKIQPDEGKEQETTDKIITGISNWLKLYVASNKELEDISKIINNKRREVTNLIEICINNPQFGLNIFKRWMAIDVYPEYIREVPEIIDFLSDMSLKKIYKLKDK